MPAKGQTCKMCSASCCYGIVGYKGLEEAELTKHPMLYSHKELLKLGCHEFRHPRDEKPCSNLSSSGDCKKEHHKPKLCRTYWCHGRYWNSKLLKNGIEGGL